MMMFLSGDDSEAQRQIDKPRFRLSAVSGTLYTSAYRDTAVLITLGLRMCCSRAGLLQSVNCVCIRNLTVCIK